MPQKKSTFLRVGLKGNLCLLYLKSIIVHKILLLNGRCCQRLLKKGCLPLNCGTNVFNFLLRLGIAELLWIGIKHWKARKAADMVFSQMSVWTVKWLEIVQPFSWKSLNSKWTILNVVLVWCPCISRVLCCAIPSYISVSKWARL